MIEEIKKQNKSQNLLKIGSSMMKLGMIVHPTNTS